MANPNLVGITTWKAEGVRVIATTSMADLIAAVTASHVYVLEAIFVSNYHASEAAYITVVHKVSSTEYEIAPRVRVAAGQVINVLLGKSLHLKDGESLRHKASHATHLISHVPYNDFS